MAGIPIYMEIPGDDNGNGLVLCQLFWSSHSINIYVTLEPDFVMIRASDDDCVLQGV